MANHKATGKKAKLGVELAQRVRAGILNALDCVEKDGMLISEILAESFKENPMKFMEMASKYVPKQIDAQVTHSVEEMTDDELIRAIRSGTGTTEKAEGEEGSSIVH